VSESDTLKEQFYGAVGPGGVAGAIATGVAKAVQGSSAVTSLVKDNANTRVALLKALSESRLDSRKAIDDFKKEVDHRLKAFSNKLESHTQQRWQAEQDLAKSLDEFQGEVDQTLETLEQVPVTVQKQIDGKLGPISNGINVMNRLKLTYLSNTKIPVFRWNWWHTHQHSATSWFDGNNPRGFGGVHPSSWTDGNHRAWDMNNDIKYIRRLFIRKGTANKYGASVCQDTYLMHSSTTARMCGVVFRILNTKKGQKINWNPEWMYTSWSGWSEDASVSMNGASTFRNHCQYSWCRNKINMDIPANSEGTRITTVVFVSSSSGPNGNGHSNHQRTNVMQFNDNSLSLKEGLEFRDDMDVATGSWKQ